MFSSSNRPPRRRSALRSMIGLISFDRRALIPTVSIFLAAVLASVITLIAFSGPLMVRAQLERAAARQPVGPERTAHPLEASAWRWEIPIGDQELTWFLVRTSDSDLPPPPGMQAWPPVGQSIVSPAVERLARSDPTIGAALPAVDSLLTDEGLKSPDELVIWTRLEEISTERGPVFENYGSRVILPTYLSRTFIPLYVAMVGLLVGVPLVVLAGAGSRSAERARRARSRSLDSVGAPVWLARACVAVEVGVPALAGSIFGVIASNQLWQWVERRGWAYADDFALPATTTATIVFILATIMGLVATVALASRKPVIARSRSTRAAAVIGFGTAVVVVGFPSIQSPTARFAIWPLGVIGVGAMLVLGAEGAVEFVARKLAAAFRRPTWLAAFRQIAAAPRQAAGLHLTMTTFVVAVVGFGPLAGIFFDLDSATKQIADLRAAYPAVTAHSDLPPDVISRMTSIRSVVPLDNATGDILADCQEMRTILANEELPCDGFDSWVVANDYSSLPGMTEMMLDATTKPVIQLQTAPLVNPSYTVDSGTDRPHSQESLSSVIGLSSEPSDLDFFRTEYTRLFPNVQPARVAMDDIIVGQQSMSFIPTFILVVAVIGTLASALATIILVVPIAEDRRGLQHYWRVIGAPDTFLYGSQLLYYALPALGMLTLGGLSTIAVVRVFTRTMGFIGTSPGRFNIILFAAVLLSGLVSTVAALMTCRAPESTERNTQ